jgi:putative peptidoglycan lipid II flippase
MMMYALRSSVIALLVGTGAFDAQAIARTAAMLGAYTLAIPTESLAHVLARGFYALQNTLIPVSVSLVAIGASVSTSLFLAPRVGAMSIPAGFAIGTGLQIPLLAILLRVWIRRTFRARAA